MEWRYPGKKDFTDEEMAEILARSTARANCERCHGRGRMGRNVTTGKHIVCVCVDKAARKVAAEIAFRKAQAKAAELRGDYKASEKEISDEALHSGITVIAEDNHPAEG